jgi:hypothetical protein
MNTIELEKNAKRYLWLQCQDHETWEQLSKMKTRAEMNTFIDWKLSTRVFSYQPVHE